MDIKASQIASVINEIYDGVERSKLGKIIRVVDDYKNPNGFTESQILNQIPYQTYLILLQNIIPKKFDSITKFEEPK